MTFLHPPREYHIVVNGVVVFHHLYIGILLMGWPEPINWFGAMILMDDMIEHTITETTPLRWLFDDIITKYL
jgi:hypothetical protein